MNYFQETLKINQVTDREEVYGLIPMICQSFGTVAEELGINQEDYPGNGAFTNKGHMNKLLMKGIKFFALHADDKIVGCVGVEKISDIKYKINRLAVLPSERHKGYGKVLLDFVEEYVTSQKGLAVGLGMINENEPLKTWYLANGFKVKKIRNSRNSRFSICFLEKLLKADPVVKEMR